ncbi:MAG: UDP-N-acetylmuramate--L-alanine ligase [Bifidobacteriaceae bacterium]|nr:UDP-N-acetylmuramate--L-alanine ligase [Bifidobacteriaceae bacterium]
MTETTQHVRPLPADDALADISTIHDLGRVYFCGIGGSGMSVLAQMLHQDGVEVTGSDRVDSAYTQHLREDGIPVIIGQSAENIHDVDTVVWSSAIPADAPEMTAALAQGLRLAHRSDILAVLLKSHRSIAVAGTHGKTTTSSMIATILSTAGEQFADPSFAIGGSLKTSHGTIPGGYVGKGEWMVAEADESDGSFEKYRPAIAVITNAEGDHLDHYGDVPTYRKAFVEFAAHATQGVVLCADDEGAREVFAASSDAVATRTVLYSTQTSSEIARVLPGGLRGARFVQISQAHEIAAQAEEDSDAAGVSETAAQGVAAEANEVAESFDIQLPHDLDATDSVRTVDLHIPGIHNARNASAAITACVLAGVDASAAVQGVGAFLGAARRFDFQGEVNGVRLYNDYAHHPTEVSVLLEAMRRRFPHRTLRVLFQPHTYSRTKIYTRELVDALKKADDIVLSHLFAAREESSDFPGISSQTLIDMANSEGVGERFSLIDDMREAGRTLAERSSHGDVIVTVGGGDINRADPVILEALESSAPKGREA